MTDFTPEQVEAVPHGEIAIFIREDGFYPIQFMGDKAAAVEAADHAALNPGTLRIENIRGDVLWKAEADA